MKTGMKIILLMSFLLCCAQEKPDLPRQYQLAQASGFEVTADIPITLDLEGEKFSGQAPINRYFGNIVESKLGPIGSTMMAGSEELMALEQKFFQALDHAKVISMHADTLIIGQGEESWLIFIAK